MKANARLNMGVGEFLAHMHCGHHRRNLANNTAGGIRSWVLGTLRRSRARNKIKICLKQCLIYVHPFPPSVTPVFLFAPLKISSQNSFLGRKKILGSICPPPPPPPSYAYGSHNFYTPLASRTKNWVRVESCTVWLQFPFSFVVHSTGCLWLVGYIQYK